MNRPILLGDSVLTPDVTPVSDIQAGSKAWHSSIVSCLTGIAMTTALVATPPSAVVLPAYTRTPLVRIVGSQTDPAQQAGVRKSTTTAEIVRNIHEDSGLTWEQISRLVGVSRRAVHMWATGAHVNARHMELLAAIGRLVAGLPASTASQRRALLLGPRPSVPSIFDEFILRHTTQSGVVAGTPFSPDELVGARYDIQEDD
jgi:hypothetical protein